MLRYLLIVCLTLTPIRFANASSDPQSTMPMAELLAQTMVPQCVQWKMIGICVWLTCTPFGCWVRYSPRVNHNNPGLVVEVKSDTLMSPMGYTALTGEAFKKIAVEILSLMGIPSDGLQSSQSGGTNPIAKGSNQSSALKFYDTTVVGNPMISTYNSSYGTAYGSIGWCQSPVEPLSIYYDSLLDAWEWRLGLFEGVLSALDYETIGPPVVDTYGNLFPRIGATVNASAYKAASTLAYRAVHIVKMAPIPHSVPMGYLPSSTTNYSWPSTPMTNLTELWSNVKPVPDTMCQSMAAELQHVVQEASTHSEMQNYLKINWTNDTCCYRRGSSLIGF